MPSRLLQSQSTELQARECRWLPTEEPLPLSTSPLSSACIIIMRVSERRPSHPARALIAVCTRQHLMQHAVGCSAQQARHPAAVRQAQPLRPVAGCSACQLPVARLQEAEGAEGDGWGAVRVIASCCTEKAVGQLARAKPRYAAPHLQHCRCVELVSQQNRAAQSLQAGWQLCHCYRAVQ